MHDVVSSTRDCRHIVEIYGNCELLISGPVSVTQKSPIAKPCPDMLKGFCITCALFITTEVHYQIDVISGYNPVPILFR